jgi:HD-GYP domain-containing protein (c-di-GMP phosphodiesterase class II)
MIKDMNIPLIEMMMSLSSAIDLISPEVYNHHKRVAFIAYSISNELKQTKQEQNELIFAGLVHDIGAMALQERLKSLNFDMENPDVHSMFGYHFLKTFPSFDKIAQLVRYHHTSWEEGQANSIPMGGYILHLADRIDILIRRDKEILSQINRIKKVILQESGKKFNPTVVEAFVKVSEKESFWFDTISPNIDKVLRKKTKNSNIELDIDGLVKLSQLFSKIIDFRSRYTAVHSCGVAATAEKLSELIGLSQVECKMAKTAGYLHDLGKLAIPVEILEKPGKLTKAEFSLIKAHPFNTYRILENIENLEVINSWAAFHHEHLDGKGYPFKRCSKTLMQGARVVAISDVLTALMEDRPYRQKMTSNQALKVMKSMVDENKLDKFIFNVLQDSFEKVNEARLLAQHNAMEEYRNFAHFGTK